MTANTTNKIPGPDGLFFVWGRILRVHEIGDYGDR